MATFRQRGDKWQAMVRRKGHPDVSGTFPNKAQAERWARGIERDIDEQKAVPSSADRRVTAKSIFEKFRDEVCDTRDGGRWEAVRIDKFLRDHAETFDVPIPEFTPGLLQDWKESRLKEVSGASVNREMNLISGVISHAIAEKWIVLRHNPVHDVTRPAKGKPRKKRAPEGTLPEIDLAKPPETSMDYVPWVATFAVETAMRMGEILGLTWQHVHARHVHVVKTKNGDPRDVPLTALAQRLLDALPKGDTHPFPINAGTLGIYYREMIGSKTGVRFHDLRHEGITRMAQKIAKNGGTVLDLAKITGHRDLKSLMVYFNPTPDELADMIR